MRKTLITSAFAFLFYGVFQMSVEAQEYVPLTKGGIPMMERGSGIEGILQALFAVSVGLAAILAVIMLAIGGFRYMTSESVFKLGDAKEQISNAIIGILIVLLSVTILATINPEIIGMDLFKTPAPTEGGFDESEEVFKPGGDNTYNNPDPLEDLEPWQIGP